MQSDRYGRRSVLFICTLLSGLALLIYGFANGLTLILVSRILSGCGGANVLVGQAYLADLSDSEARTKAMGQLGAATSAGLIAGPSALALVNKVGWSVGIVAGVLSLSGAAIILIFLKSAPPRAPLQAKKKVLLNFSLLKQLPQLRPLVTVAVVAWFSLATLEGTFGRLIERTLHYGRSEFGIVFAYESALGVAVQGFLLAWLTLRVKEPTLLRAGYLSQGLGLSLTPFAFNFYALLACSSCYAVGAGVSNATLNGIASRNTPEDRQGELFGLLQGTRSVGFVLGPILGGWLFDLLPMGPYLLAGITCVLAALLVKIPHTENTVDNL